MRRSASAKAKAREIPTWPCQAHSRQTSAFLLPRSLGPSGRDTSARGTWGYPRLPKIARKPGTSNAVVRVCQQAIFSAAKPLGAVGVQAASAGPVRRQRNGLTAPLSVQIDYGKEVRQAKVGCRLDAKGRVIGVT